MEFKSITGDGHSSISFDLARPPQRFAWFRAGMFSIFKYLSAVDENVLHSDRVLVGILERRAVGNRRRIEYHNVREHSRFEKTAMVQTSISRGQYCQSPDGFLKRNHLLFTHVLAEQSREVAVGARVRGGFKEGPFRRHRGCVRTE